MTGLEQDGRPDPEEVLSPAQIARLQQLREKVAGERSGAPPRATTGVLPPPLPYRGTRGRFSRRDIFLTAAGIGGGAVAGGATAVAGGEAFGLLFFAHDRDKGRYITPEQHQEDWIQRWTNQVRSAEYPNVVAARHERDGFAESKILPLALRHISRGNATTPIGVRELYFHHFRLADREGRGYKQVYTNGRVTYSDLDFSKLAPSAATGDTSVIQFFRPYSSVDIGRNDRVGSIPALIDVDSLPAERFVFAFARQLSGGAWEEQQLSACEVTGTNGGRFVFANVEMYDPLQPHPYYTIDPNTPRYNRLAIVITDKTGKVVKDAVADRWHWGSINPPAIHLARL